MLSLRLLLVPIGLAALSLSCGGASDATEGAVAAAPPAPKPRNAAEIAQSITSGKAGVLVYADRVRGHPIGPRIAKMSTISAVLEGTGIDPQQDLERVFFSAASIGQGHRAITIAQHRVPTARMRAAVDVLIARSSPPGAWLPDVGVPAARITVSRQTRVVALIGSADGGADDPAGPALMLVLPEDQALSAKRFVGTGGFRDPEGEEVAVALASDPHHSLRAPRAPRVPETIRYLSAKAHLAADGGLDVAMDAQSTSPEQATSDAAELTDSVEKATTVRIAIIKLRFFQPVVFRGEADHVKGSLHLKPSEIDQLLGFAEAFARQQAAGSDGSP